ncbi:MAG: hypothetical protein JW785_08740 [Acidimicrobiia bacterium]|nr:hypothetical protein [Acidimicrobiia bacterium]
MPYRLPRIPTVVGDCRFESSLMSNRWRLLQDKAVLAQLDRVPSRHISAVRLADGTRLELRPAGWGTVVAMQDDTEVGRVERHSWWGRRWRLTGPGFACDLVSDPLPRRWSLRFGTEPIGRLAGTPLSYNRLAVHTDLAVPVVALALAWHVLARPWEAAAAPGALVPSRAPAPSPYRVVRPNA